MTSPIYLPASGPLFTPASQSVQVPSEPVRTNVVRYLGAKTRVVRSILDLVGQPVPGSFFIDAFSGTGVVAREAASRGWDVRVNDTLRCAVILSTASCLTSESVSFQALGGYAQAIQSLNAVQGIRGFIWREYSPASVLSAPVERRYFTEDNAARIDAVRQQIRSWRTVGLIGEREEVLLIADLMAAVSKVANIAGTYGCFLTHWSSNAKQPLQLLVRHLLNTPSRLEVCEGDASEVIQAHSDVAYFDPPYTKRQYAAYYHILETIAYGDEPQVGGVTGLRPWQEKASDYCYKTRALGALTSLVSGTRAKRIFISYSSEGHVPMEGLRTALAPIGNVQIHDLGQIGRYRPNQRASDNADEVHEYLLELNRRDR